MVNIPNTTCGDCTKSIEQVLIQDNVKLIPNIYRGHCKSIDQVLIVVIVPSLLNKY